MHSINQRKRVSLLTDDQLQYIAALLAPERPSAAMVARKLYVRSDIVRSAVQRAYKALDVHTLAGAKRALQRHGYVFDDHGGYEYRG